jgi:hypothetical protein
MCRSFSKQIEKLYREGVSRGSAVQYKALFRSNSSYGAFVRCRYACQDEKILKEMSIDGVLNKLYVYDSLSQLQEYEMNIGYQSKTSWLLWCTR